MLPLSLLKHAARFAVMKSLSRAMIKMGLEKVGSKEKEKKTI